MTPGLQPLPPAGPSNDPRAADRAAPPAGLPAGASPARRALLLGLGYAGVALGTLLWTRQTGHVATLWYANALAAAVLLRSPVAQWPGLAAAVALAVLTANLGAGDPPDLALMFVPANLLEVLLGAWAMRRAGLAVSDLRTPQPWLDLLLRGALLPALAGATAGALTLSALGPVPFGPAWMQWFIGSSLGAVGLLPLASLALRETPASLRHLGGGLRLLVLTPLAIGTTLLALAQLPFPFIVLALPLLLAAMLLEPLALALLVFAVSLTGAIAMAVGVFVPPPVIHEFESLFVHVAFAASLIPPLLLGAAMAAMRDSHARLAERERELARANQGLEQFVRIASHDLREPLNTITQFGRLVEDDHGAALPEPARRYLGLMNEGAARMRNLLDDVLRFAQVQRGVVTDPQPVALDDVMQRVREALATSIGASHAELDLQPLPQVRGQASMLQLLFQNLVSNALKFVAPGQTPHISIRAERQGDTVRVTVADQGIGIAEADLAKLFKPFQRLHLRRQYEGNGLGLALARQVAQGHGGDIEVRSAPGQGTRFIVTLPLAERGGGATAAARGPGHSEG